ncbi:ATP-dependent DNA helicase [Natronomonas sp. EA1]|uniref:ATP-dependent DNA helicase n=1 Tax=Natronomonas sp. EA1 TaxID=3421655 RepID=UPI003EBA8E99
MTDESDWRAVFGHPSPYDEQADGIETAIETAEDSGFSVIEGACGTGKTMLALTAGIHLVRDPDSKYERVFVLTSVKQQLRQFEADLQTINTNLPDGWNPVSAMTLVGKADVCPYARENRGNIDTKNVYERCEGLRDRTRALTDDTTAGALASQARSQQVGLADSGRDGASYLETAGEPSPYPEEMPEYSDVEFCPFYAQYLDDKPEEGDASEAVPFDFTVEGLIEADDLVRLSVQHGTCPHSMMGAILPHMEVVVGNYYHAFDPTTTQNFTAPLIDDETFVVCDEAHMLEPRVRDLVSDGVGDSTLRDAERELTRVIQPLEHEGKQGSVGSQDLQQAQDLIREHLNESDVSLDELVRTRDFIRELREELDRRVTGYLDRNERGWQSNMTDLRDAEIPLRDPEVPAPDEITTWAEKTEYGEAVWSRAEVVGAVVSLILNTAEEEEKKRAAPAAGRVLNAWSRNDHTEYFREIELERTWNEMEPADSWRRPYNARLSIQNCVPSRAIGDQLGEFGGGVLMSATLAPVDVFAEVTGLTHLAEEEDRPIAERTYGLAFPEENRASFAVATPKYTHDNRGPVPGPERASGEQSDPRARGYPDEENDTRRAYARAIRQVADVPGNVLVGMPSYAEAQWAASMLADHEKPVLIDEASGDDVTEDLKKEFFDGPPKVLVTSLRGTLTEGVDYKGDRLAAAVVCGVPIINTASPRTRAVRTAYEDRFGDGFTYALTVPAVRKARQAVGRVIRGPDEVGVRVLLDERYARDSWDSVRGFLGEEAAEFRPVSPDMLEFGIEQFVSQHDGVGRVEADD